MSIGHTVEGQSKTGISVNGLLKKIAGPSFFDVAGTSAESVQVVAALKIGFQGFHIHRPRLCRRGLILRREVRLDVMGNVGGYLLFEREDIAHVALVAIGPEVPVGGSLDELRGDAHAITRALYGSFDNSIHIQFARDLR